MTDSTIERAKFTNGTVLVPICIQGEKHALDEKTTNAAAAVQQHPLIEHFPCFIAYDGKTTGGKPLLSSRATPDKDAANERRIFYGICKQKTQIGLHDPRYSDALITRADVVVRGVYDAPQKWLWTPKLLQSLTPKLDFAKATKAYTANKTGTYINFDAPLVSTETGFVPYTSNTGIVLYNMRPNGQPGRGYPFCVSRFIAMMLMKQDMVEHQNSKDRQFIMLGQFFGHVTDWEYVAKHTDNNGQFKSGAITEGTHRDICRGRLVAASANTPKTRRSDRRTFKVFLRT